MIWSSFEVGVSRFESSRTSSSISGERFWASSMMSSVFWLRPSRSIRKWFSASRYSALVRHGSSMPNSSKSIRKKSRGSSFGLKMKAEAVSASSCPSSACSSVVLPVPTSPVSTTKPLRDCTP